MDQVTIDRWFTTLAGLLARTALLTGAGKARLAEADEFMLMHETAQPNGEIEVGFKHRGTRNYLFVLATASGLELYVPVTDRPFMRGTFDVY